MTTSGRQQTQRTVSGDLSERPLRRDAERNRQRIIDAAREVFAAHGKDVGLNDIAQHAGVGVGTVYRRFPDKDLLIEAALQEQVEALLALVEEGHAAGSAWEGLTFVLRRGVAMLVSNRGLRDVTLSSGHIRQLDALRDRITPRMEKLVQRAHDEGTLRPDVTAADLIMIQLMVTEFAGHSAAVNPDAYRRYLELFIDALRSQPGRSDLGATLADADADAIAGRWLGADR